MDAQVAIVASYEGPYADVRYTVQAFSSRAELTWISQPERAAYERTVRFVCSFITVQEHISLVISL